MWPDDGNATVHGWAKQIKLQSSALHTFINYWRIIKKIFLFYVQQEIRRLLWMSSHLPSVATLPCRTLVFIKKICVNQKHAIVPDGVKNWWRYEQEFGAYFYDQPCIEDARCNWSLAGPTAFAWRHRGGRTIAVILAARFYLTAFAPNRPIADAALSPS